MTTGDDDRSRRASPARRSFACYGFGVDVEAFLAVADSVDELVFVWTVAGEMLWTNRAFTRETGMQVSDFGFDNRDNPFVHPEDLPGMLAELGAFLACDARQSSPIANRFFDMWGRIRAIRSVVHKIDWKGQPALLIVSTLIEGGEGTAETEASYRRLVESAGDGILKLSRAGRIVFSNRCFHEMLGGQRSVELAKLTLSDVLHPDDRRLADEALDRLRAGEPRGSFEARLLPMDSMAEPPRVAVNVSTIDGAGTELAFLAIARDVTQARRLEEKLRLAQQAERTHLENIARLSLYVRDLTNSPLQVLSLTAELLRNQFDGARDLAQRIENSVGRLNRLNEALAPLKDLVDWRATDMSFDALAMIEKSIRDSLGE
jgi:PAS domain S-box-containing protein